MSAVNVEDVNRLVRKVRQSLIKAHLEEMQLHLRVVGRGSLLYERVNFLAAHLGADVAAPHIDRINLGVQLKIPHGLTEGKERAAVLTAELHEARRAHKVQ